MATVLFSVCDRKQAQRLTAGMRVAGRKCNAAAFVQEGTDTQCAKCCKWGHTEFRCNRNRVFCGLCTEDHVTEKHTCPVKVCKAAMGRVCPHIVMRCAAHKTDGHSAKSFACPARKAATRAARPTFGTPEPQVDEAQAPNPTTGGTEASPVKA